MSIPAAYSLPGVRLVKPAVQGDYDGLCGLYCLINAVRLVLAPHRELKHEEVRTLFAAGVGFLTSRGALPNAVHSCVTERDWPKLAARIVEVTEAIAGRPIHLDRPLLPARETCQAALSRLDGLIASSKAACVFLRGRTRHYTVISGYTPASLMLFDSFGYRRVLRSSCGTRKGDRRRHRLHLRAIFTVSVS